LGSIAGVGVPMEGTHATTIASADNQNTNFILPASIHPLAQPLKTERRSPRVVQR
jgi:hypothetical protein